jgi:hypothetical protein
MVDAPPGRTVSACHHRTSGSPGVNRILTAAVVFLAERLDSCHDLWPMIGRMLIRCHRGDRVDRQQPARVWLLAKPKRGWLRMPLTERLPRRERVGRPWQDPFRARGSPREFPRLANAGAPGRDWCGVPADIRAPAASSPTMEAVVALSAVPSNRLVGHCPPH